MNRAFLMNRKLARLQGHINGFRLVDILRILAPLEYIVFLRRILKLGFYIVATGDTANAARLKITWRKRDPCRHRLLRLDAVVIGIGVP